MLIKKHGPERKGREEYSMKLYAGVDGGGTKTTLLCQSVEGQVVCQREFGPLNITSIGSAAFRKHLREILDVVAKTGECEAFCIGSAGCSSSQLRAEVSSLMADAGIEKWKLTGDHEIALAGALGGRDGIALIAGTGSVCIGKKQGHTVSVGGWGHLIGDEGSGYALGRECFSAVARKIDGYGENTFLVKLLEERLALCGRNEIISYVYGGDKSRVAAAAPLVLQAAAQGDSVATEIVEKNADALVRIVSAVYQKLAFEEAELVPLGGLLVNSTVLKQVMIKKLRLALPRITIGACEKTPAEGALLIASRL